MNISLKMVNFRIEIYTGLFLCYGSIKIFFFIPIFFCLNNEKNEIKKNKKIFVLGVWLCLLYIYVFGIAESESENYYLTPSIQNSGITSKKSVFSVFFEVMAESWIDGFKWDSNSHSGTQKTYNKHDQTL